MGCMALRDDIGQLGGGSILNRVRGGFRVGLSIIVSLLVVTSPLFPQRLDLDEDQASIDAVLSEAKRIGRETGALETGANLIVMIHTGDSARDAVLDRDSATVTRVFGREASLTRALTPGSLCPKEHATRTPAGCPTRSLEPALLVFRHSASEKFLGFLVTFAGRTAEPQTWRLVFAREGNEELRLVSRDLLVH